jgi:hypothetical protein
MLHISIESAQRQVNENLKQVFTSTLQISSLGSNSAINYYHQDLYRIISST